MTNEILADEQTLGELLLNHKYEVDYYQREYVWRTDEIQDLIEDLTGKFRDHSNEDWDRQEVQRSYRPYFMGAIIICEPRGSAVSYIVDGQQRLTSFTLLLIFLYHSLKGTADGEQIMQYIKSRKAGKFSFNLNIDERKDCMDSLLGDEDFIATDKTESVTNLIKRYEDIKTYFPEDIVENKQALLCFMDWLLDKVIMSKITATSDDDAYVIFETMNDRGVRLAPVEMLKGYLLANIKDQEVRTDTQKIWRQEIQALQDIGEQFGVKEKLESNCVKAWLRGQHAKTMRATTKGSEDKDFELIGSQFHRWVRENNKSLKLANSSDFTRFIKKDFIFYSYWYGEIYNLAYKYSPGFQAIRSNAYLRFNLQFPTILAALNPQDRKEEDIKCKIKIVSTYIDILLTRYIWNRKSITESALKYHMFHSVILKIRNKSIGSIARILQKNLKEKEVIPKFDQERKFYWHGINRKHIHLFLARITDYIETQSKYPTRFKEYINENAHRKNRFEIEHIIANNSTNYENYDYEDRWRISGLLLLPASVNSSIGNGSYKKKKKAYLKENLLAASLHTDTYENNPGFNQFIKRSGLNFKSYNEFSLKVLDERYNLYLDIANRIWDPEQLTKIAEEG